MSDARTFVIVGGGLAGARAAEALRSEGFEGRVVLFGDEPMRPYERPPLSKDLLRGESDFDAAAVHEVSFYEQHAIELRTGTKVAAIEPSASAVVTSAEERIRFDALLLATGSAPRRLEVPGAELEGIRYLRTLADAETLRPELSPGRRVAVIGSGWIGAEVAACAQQLGASVALIGRTGTPLEHVLGPEVGAVYRDLHASHGVELHMHSEVATIVGSERVDAVQLTDGSTIEADLVVAGLGATPRIELASMAELAIDDGVIVDRFLRAGSSNIYAAGDIANVPYPDGKRIRLEHWSAALHQGPVAARNMLGAEEPYTEQPYFFSDQWDLGMEYRGHATGWDRVAFRGDPASNEFLAFWLKDSRVLAGMNANIWDQGDQIAALVGRTVDRARLEDPDVSLEELAE